MSKLREAAQAMITAWEDGEHIHKHFFRDLRTALAEEPKIGEQEPKIGEQGIKIGEQEFKFREQEAVLAEREACAQVAENPDNYDSTECGSDVANDIAAAIRARGNT